MFFSYNISHFNCTFNNSLNGIASCNGQKDIYNKLYKKYTKLIKHNLESIALIKILNYFKQPNLNFEHSFVRIHKVLREMWLFEHEFQSRNFGKLRILGGIRFVNKLFIKLVNSISTSN